VECVVGGTLLGLVVDRVVGEEEVLVRPLPSFVGAPPVFESVALLASGRPVPVLSPHRLRAPNVRARSPRVRPGRTGPLRLLLVDDSQVTREMLRRLLEDSGFAVTAVASAGEALDSLTAREFDCLLTDVEMPDMDGLALTRHLRDTPRFAHLPVVVVSTRDRPQDRLAGLEAGADAYLAKQRLDARELVTLIQRVGGRA
jgi:CheY-like chemotaxis protein